MFSALSKTVNLPCFLLFPKHSTWQPAPLFTDKPAALIVFTFADCFHNVTGETSLHLAARYARADAAKVLLDAGGDANLQDSTGRTPLHTAVAADAQGVFQVNVMLR